MSSNQYRKSTTPVKQSTNSHTEMCNAVRTMDRLSQDGFAEIGDLARMALAWLQAPGGALHLADVADALAEIAEAALVVANDVNVAAEEVGCDADVAEPKQPPRSAADPAFGAFMARLSELTR